LEASRTVIRVPADDGSAWGDSVALDGQDAGTVELDLTDLQMPDPLLLIRLRAFIDWHCARGQEVLVTCSQRSNVRAYLERMHLASDLPPGCICGLGTLGADDHSSVLIPIRRLRIPADGDELEQELEDLYLAHFDGPLAKLADAFTITVGEISDNATTHGHVDGSVAYVAAQRYQQSRCVLAIGDLGIGIPAHMRQNLPDLQTDDEAIREATKEGQSGTGLSTRGYGYQNVIDALREPQVPWGELRIWSGKGRFRIETQGGAQLRRRAWGIEDSTKGSWIRLELLGR
jgi:hypothetical protein